MPRKWVQKQSADFVGFGCSSCNWLFKPSGLPVGQSLDEMKRNYETLLEKEFAAHDCAKFSTDIT